MSFQIINEPSGKISGVFIPIKQWKKLKKKYKDLEVLEQTEPSKEEIIDELKEAIVQLQSIEDGKLKARPFQEFLDEL